MANLSGENYAKEIAKPQQKIEHGDVFGQVHSLREEYEIEAALAVGDKILGPVLPKGARVLEAMILVDGTLGTGGILDLGHQASDDGAEAADADAFVSGVDAGGTAALKKAGVANVGLHKRFEAAVRSVAECTEASTVTSGVKIKWHILYVIN